MSGVGNWFEDNFILVLVLFILLVIVAEAEL